MAYTINLGLHDCVGFSQIWSQMTNILNPFFEEAIHKSVASTSFLNLLLSQTTHTIYFQSRKFCRKSKIWVSKVFDFKEWIVQNSCLIINYKSDSYVNIWWHCTSEIFPISVHWRIFWREDWEILSSINSNQPLWKMAAFCHIYHRS